ncbi:MAG: DUF2628 domain-containing protein [Rhizobiales bacterium]|nr:DUF2628 domain-containing protein [Hyphomicrobiales bacterium]
MARYIVHVRGEGAEALAGARFVRDGFSWLALSFGPLWFFAKGAWISACLALAALIGFVAITAGLRLPIDVTVFGALVINLLLALESGTLRSWELRLRGFRDVALVAGADLDGLERRFFGEAMNEAPAPPAPALAVRPSATVPVIGLFPSPPRGGSA